MSYQNEEEIEENQIRKRLEKEVEDREEKRLTEIKEAFEIFDKNNDGFITLKELSTVMRSSGHNYTMLELQEMIKIYDKDDSGTIDYREFVDLMIKKNKQYDDELEMIETFKAFDRNCNGHLSVKELKDVFAFIGGDLSDREIEELIYQADIDEDGDIDFQEFVHLMTMGLEK